MQHVRILDETARKESKKKKNKGGLKEGVKKSDPAPQHNMRVKTISKHRHHNRGNGKSKAGGKS